MGGFLCKNAERRQETQLGSLILPCDVGNCFLRESGERIDGAGECGIEGVKTRVDPLDNRRRRESNISCPGEGDVWKGIVDVAVLHGWFREMGMANFLVE